MNGRRILKGSLVGIVIANVPTAIFQDSNIAVGVGITSFFLGTVIAGYVAGDMAGGAISGAIIDGLILVLAAVSLQTGSLAGIALLIIWELLLVPLILAGLIGGYVAQRKSKPE
ncbi:MAG: hypothetical protein ACE5R6_07685 [Candidatus Heimdallarchaeota archaeon]